jgi:transposase
MPWRECRKVDERLRFVARLLEGEKMAVLCREFDISRKTGYKIFTRYQRCGLEGLKDRSRRSYRQANRLPFQIESLILGYKQEHPSWGAPKIREKLRRLDLGISLPAISTVHAVLDRHGLVTRGRRVRYRAQGHCALRAHASQRSLVCRLQGRVHARRQAVLLSADAFFGLSKLSVWWLRLGIGIERIKPGNPQQNGRHERMHLTLKKEATRPAGKNFLQQQSKFDHFMQEYNSERPHQALGMKYPGELYSSSLRPYRGLTEPEYPFHDRTVLVTHCGRIC